MAKGKSRIRPGAIFGRWTLVGEDEIGHGGNSTVWRGKDARGEEVAMKFLHSRFIAPTDEKGKRRLNRFMNEIIFLRGHSNRPGILSRVDDYLPQQPSPDDRPWLATKLAKPANQVFTPDVLELKPVVEFVASIAETMATLHSERIFHRDLKPENLFILNDTPVVGDFGLVEHPDKDDLTVNSEVLGPGHFIAPEMMTQANVADPGPADVFSLAKTLWVLATKESRSM